MTGVLLFLLSHEVLHEVGDSTAAASNVVVAQGVEPAHHEVPAAVRHCGLVERPGKVGTTLATILGGKCNAAEIEPLEQRGAHWFA